jgi:hypothetical protein
LPTGGLLGSAQAEGLHQHVLLGVGDVLGRSGQGSVEVGPDLLGVRDFRLGALGSSHDGGECGRADVLAQLLELQDVDDGQQLV